MIKGEDLRLVNPTDCSLCRYAKPYSTNGCTEVSCDSNEECPFQRVVKDCDGNTVAMCDRF